MKYGRLINGILQYAPDDYNHTGNSSYKEIINDEIDYDKSTQKITTYYTEDEKYIYIKYKISEKVDEIEMISMMSEGLSNSPIMMSGEGIATIENTTNFTVVNRTIIIPPEVSDVVVEGDSNSRIITFEMNRYFDGVDLSLKTIKIKYQNPLDETDRGDVFDIIADVETMSFKWTMPSGISTIEGNAYIAIEISETNIANTTIYIWNTKPVLIRVQPSIEVIGNVVPYDFSQEIDFYNNHDNGLVYGDMTDEHPPFIIDGRRIIKPTLSDFVVTQDTRSQLASFTINRYFDGMDLSTKVICIKFINANGDGDRCTACNMIVTDTLITFGWLIDSKVTIEAGNVQFAIEFIGYNEKNEFYCWQTVASNFTVVQGLDVDGMIEPPSPSWIQEWQIESTEILAEIEETSTLINESLPEMRQIDADVERIYNEIQNYDLSKKADLVDGKIPLSQIPPIPLEYGSAPPVEPLENGILYAVIEEQP